MEKRIWHGIINDAVCAYTNCPLFISRSLSLFLIRRNFSFSFSFHTCLAVAKTHGAPLFSVNVKNLFNLRVIEIKRNFKQYKLVAGLNAHFAHICVSVSVYQMIDIGQCLRKSFNVNYCCKTSRKKKAHTTNKSSLMCNAQAKWNKKSTTTMLTEDGQWLKVEPKRWSGWFDAMSIIESSQVEHQVYWRHQN